MRRALVISPPIKLATMLLPLAGYCVVRGSSVALVEVGLWTLESPELGFIIIIISHDMRTTSTGATAFSHGLAHTLAFQWC